MGTVGAEVSGHFGTSADLSYGQFGTGAEVSWVRTVLGPKCLYTITKIYDVPYTGHVKLCRQGGRRSTTGYRDFSCPRPFILKDE